MKINWDKLREKFFKELTNRTLINGHFTIECTKNPVELFEWFREKLTPKIRTISQNKYYWAILHFIEDETGQLSKALHKFFKDEFLKVEQDIIFGKLTILEPTTTELNTKQMTDYIENIALFVAEYGLKIPRPEDKDYVEFVTHYYKKGFI